MNIPQISEKYTEMGWAIINEQFPELKDKSIIWLASDYAKKTKDKIIHAECSTVPKKYQWGCPCEYTITVYEPNCDYMTDTQLKILLEHEIMHIDPKGGVRPHDLEDFKAIISKYGVDWNLLQGGTEQ